VQSSRYLSASTQVPSTSMPLRSGQSPPVIVTATLERLLAWAVRVPPSTVSRCRVDIS
jgi:hypothetical protein